MTDKGPDEKWRRYSSKHSSTPRGSTGRLGVLGPGRDPRGSFRDESRSRNDKTL